MVRQRTSPSPGDGSDESTRSKSSGLGSPTGWRRSRIWRFTVVGMTALVRSARGTARVVAPAVLAGDLVQAGLERGVERLLGGRDRIVELIGAARTHDRRGDAGLGQHPGQGEAGRREARAAPHRPPPPARLQTPPPPPAAPPP